MFPLWKTDGRFNVENNLTFPFGQSPSAAVSHLEIFHLPLYLFP